jgi:hypothetical protein
MACMHGWMNCWLDADPPKKTNKNKQNHRQHRPLAKAFNVLTDWRAWMMRLGSATDGPIVPTSPTSWIALNHQVRYPLFLAFFGVKNNNNNNKTPAFPFCIDVFLSDMDGLGL